MEKLFILAVAVCLTACGPAKKVNELATLDKNVMMPTEANRLENYDRYYAKTETGWFGLLQSTERGAGKAQITTEDKLPFHMDGGCGQVNVTFDSDMKFITAFCNGSA